MRLRPGLAVIVVLVVAGVAVAAGAVMYWLPPQSGQYSGPGIPYSVSSSCVLAGDGSWCSQGFQVNATDFNVTECYSDNSTFPTAVWGEFMNQSEYHAFTINDTLTHLGNQSAPGCFGPREFTAGPGPFWFVFIDTVANPVRVQFTISVEVPG